MYKPYYTAEAIHISAMYSIFEEQFGDGFTFPGEIHDFWECLYIRKGRLCVAGDDRIYELQTGDVVFHKPLELHKFFVECPEGAELFIFSFQASGTYQEYLKNKSFRLDSEQRRRVDGLLNFLHPYAHRLKPENRSGRDYLHLVQESPLISQRITTALYDLFLSLERSPALPFISDSKGASVFRKAVHYMTVNLSRNLTVPEIARHCKTSPTGLKRIFLKYSNLGVHQYLLKLKISAAMRRLSFGDSVTEIAQALGFSSQGHFSGAFRREIGISPTEYKTRLKQPSARPGGTAGGSAAKAGASNTD